MNYQGEDKDIIDFTSLNVFGERCPMGKNLVPPAMAKAILEGGGVSVPGYDVVIKFEKAHYYVYPVVQRVNYIKAVLFGTEIEKAREDLRGHYYNVHRDAKSSEIGGWRQ